MFVNMNVFQFKKMILPLKGALQPVICVYTCMGIRLLSNLCGIAILQEK